MKTNSKYLELLLLLSFFLCITSCKKQDENDQNGHSLENTSYYGTVCGTVFDEETGEPLQAVLVKDSKGAGSAVTGSDGNYEMRVRLTGYLNDLPAMGPYVYVYLIASKDGYYDSNELTLKVSGWDNPVVRGDFLLKKK